MDRRRKKKSEPDELPDGDCKAASSKHMETLTMHTQRQLRSRIQNSPNSSTPPRSDAKGNTAQQNLTVIKDPTNLTSEDNQIESNTFERPETRFRHFHYTNRTEYQKAKKRQTKMHKFDEPYSPSCDKKSQAVESDACSKQKPSTSIARCQDSGDDSPTTDNFFIRRKRLRSELDKDGLWDGLPIMLRYPKNFQKSSIITVNLLNNGEQMIDACNTDTCNTVVEPYNEIQSITRSPSSVHDNSLGFTPLLCSNTQPFPTSLMDETFNNEKHHNIGTINKLDLSPPDPTQNIETKANLAEPHNNDEQTETNLKRQSLEHNISSTINKGNIRSIQKSTEMSTNNIRQQEELKENICDTPILNLEKKNVNGLFREIFGPCSSSDTNNTEKEHTSSSTEELTSIQEERAIPTAPQTERPASTEDNSEQSSISHQTPSSSSSLAKGAVYIEQMLLTNTNDELCQGTRKDQQKSTNSESEYNLAKQMHSDCSSNIPYSSDECTSLSSCVSCAMACNCRIIDTSSSGKSSHKSDKSLSKTVECDTHPRLSPLSVKSETVSSKTAMSGSDQIHFSLSETDKTADTPSLTSHSTSEQGSCSSQNSFFDNCSSQVNFFSTDIDTSSSSQCQSYQQESNKVNTSLHGSFSGERAVAECSTLSCLPESHYSSNDITPTMSSSVSSIESKSSNYPINSADTTQYTNFMVELPNNTSKSATSLTLDSSVCHSNHELVNDASIQARESDNINHLGKKVDLRETFIKSDHLSSINFRSSSVTSSSEHSSGTSQLYIDLANVSPQSDKLFLPEYPDKMSETPKRSVRLKKRATVMERFNSPSSSSHSSGDLNKNIDLEPVWSNNINDGDEVCNFNKSTLSEEPTTMSSSINTQPNKIDKKNKESSLQKLCEKNTVKETKTKKSSQNSNKGITAKSRNKNVYQKIKKNKIKMAIVPKHKLKLKISKKTKNKVNSCSSSSDYVLETTNHSDESNTSKPDIIKPTIEDGHIVSIKREVISTPILPAENTEGTQSSQPSAITSIKASASKQTKARRRLDRSDSIQTPSNESYAENAKVLWLSENRWAFKQAYGPIHTDEMETNLEEQWAVLSPKVKLRYFTRAKFALLDEDKHSMKRSKKLTDKTPKCEEIVFHDALRRTTSPVRCMSDIDKFLRLKPTRQRDILKKWLKFYQKILPRRDYSRFLSDFEQTLNRNRLSGCDGAPTGTDMEYFHRKILFECMKRIKPKIINNCNEKYQLRIDEINSQYTKLIWELIDEDYSNLTPGFRSKRLEQTLKDLVSLENGGHVDVTGHLCKTSSYTCILSDLDAIKQNTDELNNQSLLHNIPEPSNTGLTTQILENLRRNEDLPILDLTDLQTFECELNEQQTSPPNSRGDAFCVATDGFELDSPRLIETRIRDLLHQEAVDAFIRSNESSTKSCCDLDSPSCILSTWIAADYYAVNQTYSQLDDESS